MKLRLLEPATSFYWMLVAEELQDPANWSVFLLNHGPDTERFAFEKAIEQSSAENNVKLNPYRLRCRRGISSYEYHWQAGPVSVIAHARMVGQLLQCDVELPHETATAC